MVKQISDYPPVLTVAQAAELLQYDPDRVYELIRKKVHKPFSPGVKRGMRLHRDSLLENG